MSVVASPVSPSSLAADDRKRHRPPGPLLGFAPADAERILAHLVALDVDDRFLRFGYGIGDEGIARYVARIDFALDHVHGLTDAGGRVVALAHIAARDGEVDCLGYRRTRPGSTRLRRRDGSHFGGASAASCAKPLNPGLTPQ